MKAEVRGLGRRPGDCSCLGRPIVSESGQMSTRQSRVRVQKHHPDILQLRILSPDIDQGPDDVKHALEEVMSFQMSYEVIRPFKSLRFHRRSSICPHDCCVQRPTIEGRSGRSKRLVIATLQRVFLERLRPFTYSKTIQIGALPMSCEAYIQPAPHPPLML